MDEIDLLFCVCRGLGSTVLKPVRYMSSCIRDQSSFCFRGSVVMPIGNHWIWRHTVFLCHGNGKGTQWNTRKGRRAMLHEPPNVCFTGMTFTKTIGILFRQMNTQLSQPHVISHGLTSPTSAWVMNMTRTISRLTCGRNRGRFHRGRNRESPLRTRECYGGTILLEFGIPENPMSRIEKLAGFQEHFNDVLVHMPSGGLTWMRVKHKDIHEEE
jgi:hypothetical protein